MLKPAVVLVLFPLAVLLAWSQPSKPAPSAASPTYQPVPVAAARQPNPVKPTPESIAHGKRIYTYDCAMCHGALGDGKTDTAKDLKIPDLTDPALLKDRTDGELFYILKNGHGDMPPEGNRVKPNHLWDLVNYTRSLAKKKPPPDAKPSD